MTVRRGQGFVELLIAIAVLMVSAVATVTLIVATLGASDVSKSQVLAVNLGREGIEAVRALRDTNWLKADGGVLGTDGKTLRFDVGLSEVFNPVVPPIVDHSAIPVFNATTNAWTLDFVPNETDFSARSDSTAIWFNRNSDSGVYTQGTGASLPVAPFQKANYWRLVSLYPICWDLTPPPGKNPEDTEEVLNEDISAATCTNGEIIGVEVHSRMEWTERGRFHSLELVDKLFDWKV